jgi:disulfide oxidoreductase YuzD
MIQPKFLNKSLVFEHFKIFDPPNKEATDFLIRDIDDRNRMKSSVACHVQIAGTEGQSDCKCVTNQQINQDSWF